MILEIEYPLNLFFVIIGSFLCLTLGIFLLFNKSVKNKANFFLGIMVFLTATYFFPAFFYRFSLLDDFPHIIGISYLMPLLIGPLAYFYIQTCTQKDFRLKAIHSWHFLPFFLDLLSDIPLFMESGPEKVARYHEFLKSGRLFEHDWALVLKSIHGIIYFFICIDIIKKYRQHLTNASSSIDNIFHRWMLFYITILAFPMFFLMFYVYFDYSRLFITSGLLGFFIFLMTIYSATLLKPELFHTFPHQMLSSESQERKKQRYESSNLQEEQKDKYIKKLNTYMQRNKPYLKPDLTLSQLAEEVKIPTHYLSQVINEKLDCNFIDFINNYRVEEVKSKLVNPKLSHYTIISIAYEAGFSAKSTFNAVFKKVEGITPSQYRKNNRP